MANNTAGGSWWKQLVEWGSDVYDAGGEWWDDSFGDIDYNKFNKSPGKFTTGIGGREIDISGAQMGAPSSSSGWGWWDTVKKYAGYGGDVLDWTSDVYKASPKWVQDWVQGRGKEPDKDNAYRQWLMNRRNRQKKGPPQGAATRNIGLGRRQTRPFKPQSMGTGGYGNSPLANAIMEQASKNASIRSIMAGQISKGRQTIGINQSRINLYLSSKYGLK